ncbi:MAG: hypothetical protein K9G63_02780 [Melioribacteraceae bacterium]|nr:hypothetical protein [Melioribacteraceae bacterium]
MVNGKQLKINDVKEVKKVGYNITEIHSQKNFAVVIPVNEVKKIMG